MTTVTYINDIKLTYWRKEIMEELLKINEDEIRPLIPTDIHFAVLVENKMDEGGIDWSECEDHEFESEVRYAITELI